MTDYIEREKLLGAYDAEHNGQPGRARELILSAHAADVVPWDWLLGYAANSWSRKDYTDFLTGAKEVYSEVPND